MRLIDADAVVKMLEVFIANTDNCVANKDYNFAYRRCKRLIQDEPNAYSLDKVVEELEEQYKNSMKCRMRNNEINKIINREFYHGECCAYADAIEIVKAGAMNDNN